MKIDRLELKNYRNFRNIDVEFSKTQTLIVGPNGSGKSNILEAVYFLATGDAVKAQKEEEVIKFGESFAKIIGVCDGGNSEETTFDLTVELGPYGRPTKTAQINGVKKPLNKFLGVFRAVEFNPANLSLVSGPPDVRRRYLNSLLSQVSYEYRANLSAYEKTRKQKNYLLEKIREGGAKILDLEIWNEKLLEFGEILQEKRREFFDFLEKNTDKFVYKYCPSVFSATRLNDFLEREVFAGVSLIGPHRDDFSFATNNPASPADGSQLTTHNLAYFGSRGEQRMAVFELKRGEIGYFERQTGEEPVLLLDDIFSELDEAHRGQVLGAKLPSQVIFTAVDKGTVNGPDLAKMRVVRL